jgi:hypothetical protein
VTSLRSKAHILIRSVLIKNKRSGQIVDYAKIDRLVKASQAPGGLFFKNFFGGKKGNGKPNKFASSAQGKRTTTAKGNGNMPSLRARDGEEVGGGAERIVLEDLEVWRHRKSLLIDKRV